MFNVRCVLFHFFYATVKFCVVFVEEIRLGAIPVKYGRISTEITKYIQPLQLKRSAEVACFLNVTQCFVVKVRKDLESTSEFKRKINAQGSNNTRTHDFIWKVQEIIHKISENQSEPFKRSLKFQYAPTNIRKSSTSHVRCRGVSLCQT